MVGEMRKPSDSRASLGLRTVLNLIGRGVESDCEFNIARLLCSESEKSS